ncbi:MAG: DUF2911 domain-containing protein [Bacteroidota bacterium]
MKLKQTFFLLCLAMFTVFSATAQDLEFPKLDPSPMDVAHYPARSAYKNYLSADDPDRTSKIKVLYCRPNKKDRVIFGDLVPYGQTWRLGANEATEVTFFTAVEIGGTYVPAGTYTMNADVFPNQWIIRISSERFVAGTANLDPSKIIATATANVSVVPTSREAFTIGFQKVDEGNVNMVFEWDQTRATMPVSFNPVMLSGDDASPMDLVQFPASSRLRNFQKPEDLDKAVAKVRVVYSRPQKKGRDVWGTMKKTGDMWRVGANETTEVTFFQDVTIGGTKVKKGKYGLFAKINDDSWDFIIHKNVQSWGHPNHDEKDNVVTVNAKTLKTPETVEAMTILLQENGSDAVDLIVAWDDLMAKLPISLK